MTNDHKAKLAAGRDEARVVKAYLEALEAAAPKRRGRRRTKASIGKRLAAIETELASTSALKRLQLLQEQSDLKEELAGLDQAASSGDLDKLRAGFIKVARGYSERKGISYATWRAIGIDAGTLTEAGLRRI